MPPRLAWSGAAHDRNLVLSSLVDRLAHNYRVVCFDRPGVRYSDRPCTRILDGHNASSLTLFAPRAVKLSIHWVSERARATADCCRWPAGSCLGRSFGYPSRHGMPKLSQLLAKASFASASSKQKRQRLQDRSTSRPCFLLQCGRPRRAADVLKMKQAYPCDRFGRLSRSGYPGHVIGRGTLRLTAS